MHIVETYDPTTTDYPGGRRWPALALLEDDAGFRWLLTASGTTSDRHWSNAAAAGAAAVLTPSPTGWLAAGTERYGTARPTGPWAAGLGIPFAAMPSLLELLAAEQAGPAPSAGDGFVSLHTHTENSPVDGLSRIPDLVRAAAAFGAPALGITDHGYCTGHPDLQTHALNAGINPVFGLEAYLVDDVAARGNQFDYWHLILLAADDEGLRNLWALSTATWRDGFYGKPRADWPMLARHSKGLIATTACLGGPISKAIMADDTLAAQGRLARLGEIFGDNLFIELQSNGAPEQKPVNEELLRLARAHNVGLIAAADSHYTSPADAELHRAWLACATNSTLDDDSGMFSAGSGPFHLHDAAQMRSALSYLPEDAVAEAMATSVRIGQQATARIATRKALPLYSKSRQVPDDVAELRRLAEAGWNKIANRPDQDAYRARLARELDVIIAQDFCGYFLMVADYCLDPSTPVLTEDLRWVEVGKLEVGDRIVGFDENKVVKQKKGHRYWHSAEVVNTRRIVLPTYKIVLEDGTETITSEDHQWLVASPSGSTVRWVRTRDLRIGQRPQRLVSEWSEPDTWEAGYIAGILDGEGSLSLSKINNGGHSLSLGFAQKEGVVLETALRILDAWGFSYSLKDHGSERNGLRSVWIRGGRAEVMRLLGMARPQRLLAKLDVDLLGRVISIDNPAITSVEPLGPGEVVALETTTGTLVAQGFAHHNCRWAKDSKILVGPGRGSGAACLVAYLIGITEIDPVRYNLPFERFLTPGRTSLPDFDVDFPSTRKSEILSYLRRRFGEDHVVTIGTTLRLKNKAVVAELGRAMKHELGPEAFTDLRTVADFIDEAEAGTAGLGLSWEDLWAQHGDQLQHWRAKYPKLFQTADGLVGLLKTYGRHAAGVIISTDEPLTGTLPLRAAEAGEQMISQFDDGGVEGLGLVKFDILTLRTLDTIQHAVDAIEARYGRRLDLYGFNQEFDDPQVWDMVCSGQVLGIFQIETALGIQMCRRLAPRNLTELADVIALVRPGPRNSGITDAYLARRAGEQQVSVPDPRLAEVLGPTYGTIVYQEQVLAVCRLIAGYDDAQADVVRKILGKKQVEKIDAAGRDFVDRATERGMPRNNALLLWEQMAEFAKYAFGLGHAYGYAVLAYWTAFLKAHFPVEFCAAVLSTVKKDRIPTFVKEARLLGVPVLPPDINTSKIGFTIDGRSVRYGVDSLKGIGDKAAEEIVTHAPYTSVADLSERTGSAVNAGTIRLLARAGAFDSLPGEPHRAALMALLDPEAAEQSKRCVDRLDDAGEGEEMLPCRFDWGSEPPPINPKNGKTLKAKPAPKKCTVRCRQYRPGGPRDVSVIAPYTPAQIGQIELDMLGMYLSWTPFDRIPPEHAELRRQYRAQADLAASGDPGTYTVLALVDRAKPYTARSGLSMGFITLTTEGPDLDTACMSKLWGRIQPDTLPGAMVLAQVQRTERGLTLLDLGRW